MGLSSTSVLPEAVLHAAAQQEEVAGLEDHGCVPGGLHLAGAREHDVEPQAVVHPGHREAPRRGELGPAVEGAGELDAVQDLPEGIVAPGGGSFGHVTAVTAFGSDETA